MIFSVNCYAIFVAVAGFSFSMLGPGVPVDATCTESTLRIWVSQCPCPEPCETVTGDYVCKYPAGLSGKFTCRKTESQQGPCDVIFDYDEDSDIDLADFALLQNARIDSL